MQGLFDISKSKQAELTIGEPIKATLGVQKKNDRYSFDQNVKGSHGENIDIKRNGSRPRAPKLHIKNKDGSYDRSFNFKYG